MIDHLWQYLLLQVHNNQFFSGAALTGVLLGLAAYLRGMLTRGWAMLVGRLVVSFTIHSEDPLYLPLSKWLQENQFDRFARRYRIRSTFADSSTCVPQVIGRHGSPEPATAPGGAELAVKSILGPDYGTYLFRFSGKWLRVSVAKEGDSPGQGSSGNAQTREFLTIRYVGGRALIDRILAALNEAIITERVTALSVRRATQHGWEWSGSLERRHNEACPVVLTDGQLQSIVEDIEVFFTKRAWYHERGIPWRRGYLLHGPPGTGKTSLCRYLAQHFGLNIYIVDASGYHGSNLAGVLRDVAPRSIILFEDIDCHLPPRQLDASAPAPPPSNADLMPVNIGTLLNAIDGICPPEQVLVFMTTNHISKLDPALIRPGRVDRQYYLGPCTRRHACRLFAKFFPDADLRAAAAFEAVVPDGELSPADLQGIFIAAADAEEAVTAVVARAGAPTPSEATA